MILLDYIYTNKYNSLMRKIEELNKRNVMGYKTFREYVLSDELMIMYFKELKNLEQKFSKLHVDSYETFENRLFQQLKTIYDKMLIEIYQKNEEENRIKHLQELQNDINGSYGHGCDEIIEELLRDLDYKIKNYDKFKVNSFMKEILYEDPLMEEIINYIAGEKKVTAALLQRKFKLSYSRASHIINILEKCHYIGKSNGISKRDVFINQDNVTGGIIKSSLVEMSEEEYQEKLLKKNRAGKTIEDIMLEYNIKIDYGEKDLFKNLENSLIINFENEYEKCNLINTFVKYMEPEKLKLVLASNDQLTFNGYYGLPHLMYPIINDYGSISETIELLSKEIENRYNLFLKQKVKSIYEFNKISSLPYILIVIDELSEIINNKQIYDNLLKILLNSSRTGIKLIMFTKFSRKNINIGSIEDLIKISNKFDIDSIINRNTENIIKIDTIDNEMNGLDFENCSKELLYANGFDKVEVTQASGDYGVDIIAYKEDIKYAIQCKKYSSPVGIKAVQEVIGSKSMNDCHVAAVLTNNTFTKSAKELAEKNGVLLWDRNKLEQFIDNYRNKEN